MRLLPRLLVFLCLAVTCVGASAQTPAPPTPPRGNFWKCTLPGGVYEVFLRQITAISTAEYVVEGGIKVTQLTIDTTGKTEARFYYMQTLAQAANGGPAQTAANAAQQKLQQATDRVTSAMTGGVANEAMNTMVVKTYPTTTHANTVEYRVATLGEIDELFKSLQTSWETNTNTSYPPPPPNGASGGTSGGTSRGQ